MERAGNATIGEWEQNLRAVEKWNWKTAPVWTRKRTKRQSFLFCFSKRFKTYQTIFPNFSKSNGPKTLIPQMEFTHWSEQSHSRVPLRIPFVVSDIYTYIYISLPAFTFTVSFTIAFVSFSFSLSSLCGIVDELPLCNGCSSVCVLVFLAITLLPLQAGDLRVQERLEASRWWLRWPMHSLRVSAILVFYHYSLLFPINAWFSFWMFSVCTVILFGWIYIFLCYAIMPFIHIIHLWCFDFSSFDDFVIVYWMFELFFVICHHVMWWH